MHGAGSQPVPGREFVGLANFRRVMDGDLFQVLQNTIVFTVGSTVLPFLIGLALALALNQKLRGSSALRGLFLLPWVIPTVVASFLWLWLLNANYGVLNGFMLQLGLIEDNVLWLGRCRSLGMRSCRRRRRKWWWRRLGRHQ